MYHSIKQKGYQKLEVWKKAHKFVILVYKHSKDFPKSEEYGLISQLRRAVLSISTNIVQGQASRSKREFLNFLNMANRSLVETEYLSEVALQLQYLSKNAYDELDRLKYEIGILLNSLTRSVRTKL